MYPLSPELVDFLLTDAAQAALGELASHDLSERASIDLLARLRRIWTPAQAAALLDQARLRGKAGDKFRHPERLLFTDDALQQASSRAVAAYRAQQFAHALNRRLHVYAAQSTAPEHVPSVAGDRSSLTPRLAPEPASPSRQSSPCVADLGCGLGADTIALAEAGLHVLAVERDPIRARIAAANVAALGLADHVAVLCADWTTLNAPWTFTDALPLPLSSTLPPGECLLHAAFIDPSRRAGDQRIFNLASMDPPIAAVLDLLDAIPTLAVKTLPGIAHEDIPANAEVEFISERGHMKEALLRFGDLLTGAARRATLLPGPHHLDSNAPQAYVPSGEPLAYLLEPDAAVIRATLVQHLAAQLGAAQLDPSIAYLTADTQVETPFARAWRVLRHGPFHLKELNRWLRELQAGAVVVKKRGSAIDPDEFRRRLKTTPGGPEVTVFLTRVQGRPWMIAGAELPAHGPYCGESGSVEVALSVTEAMT